MDATVEAFIGRKYFQGMSVVFPASMWSTCHAACHMPPATSRLKLSGGHLFAAHYYEMRRRMSLVAGEGNGMEWKGRGLLCGFIIKFYAGKMQGTVATITVN